MTILFSFAALSIGSFIGWGFGAMQNNAFRRHRNLQENGKLNTGWSIMPGSMRRVTFLIVGLVLLQIIFPILFSDSMMQWLISAGVIIGYGLAFVHRLRTIQQFHS